MKRVHPAWPWVDVKDIISNIELSLMIMNARPEHPNPDLVLAVKLPFKARPNLKSLTWAAQTEA
ncbi:hypothetical protein OEG84_20865 [Hoeflea sp. G2-23]|uniref:Uncharacterized protein n=1 Tax=Hoeflea algicola TaxID=2983763 RepID=A0ABT3ZE64_9HYPH|nr:hypothetical protein [Hoeflea algicola]MCY0150087.1 hypothetical protein [Hoeflea algicola]